jgi:hypothetical protein
MELDHNAKNAKAQISARLTQSFVIPPPGLHCVI